MTREAGATQRFQTSKPVPSMVEGPPGRAGQLAAMLWMLGHSFRFAPMPITAWSAVALLRGLLVGAQIWLTKTVVDALAAPTEEMLGWGVPTWLALLIVSLALNGAAAGMEPWVKSLVREQVGPRFTEQVMRKSTELELVAFEHQEYYSQLSRVMHQDQGGAVRATEQTLELIRQAPMWIVYASALALVSPILLAIAFVTTLPVVVRFIMSGQRAWSLLYEQTRDIRLAAQYASYLTDRRYAQEIRLFGLSGYMLDRWKSYYWKTRNERRRLAAQLNLRERGFAFMSMAGVMVGLWWLVVSGRSGATAGAYAVLIQSITGFANSMFYIGSSLKRLSEISGYAHELKAFLALPTEIGDSDVKGAAKRRPFPQPLSRGIRFEDVWFTYPGSERPALAGVSFEIRAGERVALVGENGAGKTTIVKLLLGLYRPDAGRVTIDGRDVSEIDPMSLRAACSGVFQHFIRYQLSLGENIAIGQVGEAFDRQRVLAAAERAGVTEIAAVLPDGYDTLLGPEVGGTDLSGGQWQRIAIARAVFREAQVLVLDEPTAALDPLAELAIFERFASIAEGKTALLISHRLGMARLADRVLVLSDGRVVEDGPHEALMHRGGDYAALFQAQARWYA